MRLRGALAWWFWGAVHVALLVGLRSRISVMLDWFWAYLTFRSGTRLITGGSGEEPSGGVTTVIGTDAALPNVHTPPRPYPVSR